MLQHSRLKSIIYHLYPGAIITLFFILTTPYWVDKGFPPQFSMLVAIAVVVIPVILIHLNKAKKEEGALSIQSLNRYKEKLSTGSVILYSLGIILFAYIVYGATQPLNIILEGKIWYWLPDWYKVRDFTGYSDNVIVLTLVLNLILNGVLAPYLEELYFRGYLLPRMESWRNYAPLSNAILFSFYHFWQPQIYLTLIMAMFPLSYFTWKTKSLKLAIYSHCGLNLIGALLSFASLNQHEP